ncbi:MAG TPA: peptidylprolyl isomerase [Geobacter sp.]|nr:peptidylprolyl isomerase [Geobacter sp.]
MSQLKRIASSTLTALVLGALCAGASLADQAVEKGQSAAQAKSSPADAVVRVNGKPITRLELDRSMKIMLTQSRAQILPTELKKAQEGVLEQLTNSELLYQAAQEVEMKELDQQVKRQIEENRKRYASEVEFEAALAAVDMTRKELEEFTRRDVAINNMLEKRLGEKIEIGDNEAKNFYDDNKSKYFDKKESVRASHILIGLASGATEEAKKEAREKAQALQKRAQAGEDFAKLAQEASTCPSKAKGGDLGVFGKGDMVVTFEKAAWALKPGEISEVVETQFGFHVIKLTDRIAPKTEKYDEVKEKIVDYLKKEKIRSQVPALIKELREKAKIEKV